MTANISRWSRMEAWVPGGHADLTFAFPLVPLSEILRPRREKVVPGDFASHNPITIHFDGSVDRRVREQPFKGSMFAARAGDLLYSKIDLRNGALALLPSTLEPAVVTSEY